MHLDTPTPDHDPRNEPRNEERRAEVRADALRVLLALGVLALISSFDGERAHEAPVVSATVTAAH